MIPDLIQLIWAFPRPNKWYRKLFFLNQKLKIKFTIFPLMISNLNQKNLKNSKINRQYKKEAILNVLDIKGHLETSQPPR